MLYPALRPPRQRHTVLLVGTALVLAPVSILVTAPVLGRLLGLAALWLAADLVFMRSSVRYHRATDADPMTTGILLSVVFTGVPIGGLLVLVGHHGGVDWLTGSGLGLIAIGLVIAEQVRRRAGTGGRDAPDEAPDSADGAGSE